MTNKNKTISFRVKEEKFNKLKDISETRDIPLSRVFRDYVDEIIAHDGKVRIVADHEVIDENTDTTAFPPTVTVPKTLIREHERLELENEHLREQLAEYKRYVHHLEEDIENAQVDEDIVSLEEVDAKNGSSYLQK